MRYDDAWRERAHSMEVDYRARMHSMTELEKIDAEEAILLAWDVVRSYDATYERIVMAKS